MSRKWRSTNGGHVSDREPLRGRGGVRCHSQAVNTAIVRMQDGFHNVRHLSLVSLEGVKRNVEREVRKSIGAGGILIQHGSFGNMM